MSYILKVFSYIKRLCHSLFKRIVGAKKKREKVSLQSTGFWVKAYGKGKVQVSCDYIPGVWIRQFEYRKLRINEECSYSNEWLSNVVAGSRVVETVYGLEAGEVYIFRIVNIGHDNQRVYSEEITYVVPSADVPSKPEFSSSKQYSFDRGETDEQSQYIIK